MQREPSVTKELTHETEQVASQVSLRGHTLFDPSWDYKEELLAQLVAGNGEMKNISVYQDHDWG